MSQSKSALRRDGFTFKQFFIAHDKCAMKVGSDGILLGAWAPVVGVNSILDIGTGSGLLALMLAQRTADNVTIDAVELDPDASAQARNNCEVSPWRHRITVHLGDITVWAQQQTGRYELIVSNPPYYLPGIACRTAQRDQARHNSALDHPALLLSASQRITESGFLCVVLPESESDAFTQNALENGWHSRLRTDVAEMEGRLPHRVLLAFSPQHGEYFADQLIVRGPDQHYSQAYCALTKGFYLFM